MSPWPWLSRERRDRATGRDLTMMVLKSALGLVLAGLVVGAPMAGWSPRGARLACSRSTRCVIRNTRRTFIPETPILWPYHER
jgi:hypothetical protein